MSDKKFAFPKISLPELNKEIRKKALVCGAAFAAVTVTCALLLSGVNALLTAVTGEISAPAVSDAAENIAESAAASSSQEEVAVK